MKERAGSGSMVPGGCSTWELMRVAKSRLARHSKVFLGVSGFVIKAGGWVGRRSAHRVCNVPVGFERQLKSS